MVIIELRKIKEDLTWNTSICMWHNVDMCWKLNEEIRHVPHLALAFCLIFQIKLLLRIVFKFWKTHDIMLYTFLYFSSLIIFIISDIF